MKKIILAALCLSCLSFCLSGCGNKYNAVLYDNANEWIKEDFADNYHTKNTFNESKGTLYDDCESSYSFIVKDKEKFEEVFKNDIAVLKDVDFSKEMILVYTFTDNNQRKNHIKSIKIKDKILTISYKQETKISQDTSNPYQRWFVIRLDKLDIEFVNFIDKSL